MIEVPMFVWIIVGFLLLTQSLKNLGTIATAATMLRVLETRRTDNEV